MEITYEYVNELALKVNDLKTQNQTWRDENDKLAHEVEGITIRKVEAQKELDTLTPKLEELRTQVTAVTANLDSLMQTVETKKQEASTLVTTGNSLRDEITKLQQQRDAEAVVHSTKGAELAERERIVGINEATLKDYRAELDTRQALLERREEILLNKQRLSA